MYRSLKLYSVWLIAIFIFCFATFANGQRKGYWQQKADYIIDIDFDTKKHQYKGTQKLLYTNNSADTLLTVYYHLYYNAFQPNSMMDSKSRHIKDPDPRVKDRIFNLKSDEIGYQKVNSIRLNGSPQAYSVEGTILKVKLNSAILPGSTVLLEMDFEAQVPLQIRRAGRNNEEGIDYSMAQWYPKICQYDDMGWHANPYIGREFYPVWGNYEVFINIDSRYILAGTGDVVNASEVGYGYSDNDPPKRPAKLKWHFRAQNVHDFVWAADPDYVHEKYMAHDGTLLRFFYQPGEKTTENWKLLPEKMDEALRFMNMRYGKYPYHVYAFIQGGDGGMEYPMATLITGERPLNSLVGVSIHEMVHSWYQGVLASNEALYPWMDEGFTSFGTTETLNYLYGKKLLNGKYSENPFAGTIRGFSNFIKSGLEEPLSIHADHYVTNSAYGVASYSKGALTLVQLEYIMGKERFAEALLDYFDKWKFKHPRPIDFIRVMEKTSGMELKWFLDYWLNTTHYIDYAIDSVSLEENEIFISRKTYFPMPLDIIITTENGEQILYYVRESLMMEDKIHDIAHDRLIKGKPWDFTQPEYKIQLDQNIKVKSVQIDPSGRLADVNKENNIWPVVSQVVPE